MKTGLNWRAIYSVRLPNSDHSHAAEGLLGLFPDITRLKILLVHGSGVPDMIQDVASTFLHRFGDTVSRSRSRCSDRQAEPLVSGSGVA